MGFRHLATFSLAVGLNTVFACGHAPLPEAHVVSISYPVQSPRCDNQLPISTSETQLLVPHIRQSQPSIPDGSNSLCWAAGISMVSTYLGKPLAPCQVATFRFGGAPSCCHNQKMSDATFLKECNRAAGSEEMSKAMSAIDLHFIHLDRPLSEREIKTEISNGRPVLLSRDTTHPYVSGDGQTVTRHVLVISGYHHDKFHVIDPAINGSLDDLTHQELVRGKNGDLPWRASWTYISFRSDACNPRFNNNCDCALR